MQLAAGTTFFDVYQAAVECGAIQELDPAELIVGQERLLPYPPLAQASLRGMSRVTVLPLPPRRILVAVASDRMPSARLYNSSTGVLERTFRHPVGKVRSAMMAKDGSRLVTTSEDCVVRVFNVSSGQCTYEFSEHTDWVRWAEFSPDGRYIVTASRDDLSKLIDLESATVHTLEGNIMACFSPDGRRVLTTSDDEEVNIYDVASGELEKSLQLPSCDAVGSAMFSPDGRKVVVAVSVRQGRQESQGRAWLFDVETEGLDMVFEEDMPWAKTAQISPDGRYVLTCSKHAACVGGNSVPKIFDIATGLCVQRLEGLRGFARSASFSPDGLVAG